MPVCNTSGIYARRELGRVEARTKRREWTRFQAARRSAVAFSLSLRHVRLAMRVGPGIVGTSRRSLAVSLFGAIAPSLHFGTVYLNRWRTIQPLTIIKVTVCRFPMMQRRIQRLLAITAHSMADAITAMSE